jgi:hypothetical protein
MMKEIFTGMMLAMLITALPAWGLDMTPGKYEITTQVEMPGMPRSAPPQTITQCLEKQNPVPNASSGSQGCKVSDLQTKGNTVTYTMTCDQQGMKMKSTGQITYNKDTFEGKCQTVMGPQAGGMTIITVMKGKRIGTCD